MKLITHNGRFHYDELLATAILKKIYPDASIIRTRDQTIINSGDIVYDVGGVYDHLKHRYDHHQYTFSDTFSDKYNIKMSSCGLIFKHFHEKLFEIYNILINDSLYDKLVNKVYEEFFLCADAIDNGINVFGNVKPRTISDVISLYNEDVNGFDKALFIVETDFFKYIENVINFWYKKYRELKNLIRELDDYILISNEYYDINLILEIEAIYGKNILYMVYPYESEYKIRAINISSNNFDLKKPLNKKWRGKKDKELEILCDGGVFVHSTGFIGSNKTKEGAIKMCRESYFSE